MRELALRKLLPHTVAGFAGGVVLLAVIVGILWLVGGYRVDGLNTGVPWFRELLLVGLLPGVIEEIISRGVLYRIVEDRWGSWIALVFSAVMFGLMHAGNPNATLWSCIAIAIEAGLLLGILYTVTRSLYVCIGLHMAWNFMEGPVLGTPVSGIELQSLLQGSLLGPHWLTGGAFGIEASLVTVGLMGGLSVGLMAYAQRRGLIRPWPTREQRAMDWHAD